MQGRKVSEGRLFYDIQLENLVPHDHSVRLFNETLDLSFLYEATRSYYSHEGKPSIDPVVLFKLYIIGYFFGINSERKLFREIQVNVAYRWFIGYDLDEELPHHSIMTKSRYRFPKQVFALLFTKIISLCRDEGILSGDYYFIDSSLIKANASRESFRYKVKTEDQYLYDLDNEKPDLCKKQSYGFDGTVDPNKMGNRRKTAKKSEYMISQSDEDAQIITRPGKGTFPAYKAHFCVDRKKRIILSVMGSSATEDDMSKIDDLYTSSKLITGKKPKVVVADSHYGGIECLKYFQDKGISTCIQPRNSVNSNGLFPNNSFKVSSDFMSCTCPAGKQSVKTVNVKSRFRFQYRFLAGNCNVCPMKGKCTNSKKGRIVSIYQESYIENAKNLVESVYGKRLLKARQIHAEGAFGEAKVNHLLARCMYRGLSNFDIQLLLTASVINLKRLLKAKNPKNRIDISKHIPYRSLAA